MLKSHVLTWLFKNIFCVSWKSHSGNGESDHYDSQAESDSEHHSVKARIIMGSLTQSVNLLRR